MSRIPFRAAVGLALALALAALGSASQAAGAADDDDVVTTAGVGEPVVFALLDEVRVPSLPVAVVHSASAHLAAASAPPEPAPPAPPSIPVSPPAAPAGSVEAIIDAHFGAAAGQARAIAACESHLHPDAVSPTNDHGLFQINIVHRGQFEAVTGAPWSSVYDPTLNTIYAKHLYDAQGWSPWVCARKVL